MRGLGIFEGTFVRVGAVTRKADEETIKELQLRGASQSFDRQLYVEAPFDASVAEHLCEVINGYRKKAAESRGDGEPPKEVTPKTLRTGD